MENFWLNGVEEFNALVRADTSHNIPAWLIMDPYDIALVKQGDPRALLLPPLEVNVPTKLFLQSGKAVVMSSKPAVSAYGKAVKWMTIGSHSRALEVILGADKCIKVCLTASIQNSNGCIFSAGVEGAGFRRFR